MTLHRAGLVALLLVFATALLAACGGGNEPESPTPTNVSVAIPTAQVTEDAIANSVQQTVAAIAVAQTVAALTTGQPAATSEVAAATSTTAPPATDPAAQATATLAPTNPPVATAPTCNTVSGINLRSGPGMIYEPPLVSLGVNVQLRPLAFSPAGFPQGQWLNVQVVSSGQVGWLSASPQYVVCNVDLASLPLATNLPPTPQPPPTAVQPTSAPTATTVVVGPPPTSQNKPNGGTCIPGEDVQNIFTDIIMDPNYLFRVTAYDDRVGTRDGDGIDEIEFTITSENTGLVFSNTESNPAYCVFEGGEPNCNPWGIDDQGRYHWGNSGPVVEAGEYFVLITLRWDEPDSLSGQTECNWNSGNQPLVITLP